MTDTVLQQALAAAQANENKAREAAEKAAAAVRSAQAARDALIGDAAAGKPVKAENVRAAEEATRAAEIDAEIAARIVAAAVTQRDEAQDARWQEEAAERQAAVDEAVKARLAAGAAVDDALSGVRAKLSEHKAAGVELHNAIAAANHFNSQRETRRASNAPLRARIAAGQDDPFVRNVPRVQPGALEVFLYPQGGPGLIGAAPIASAKIL